MPKREGNSQLHTLIGEAYQVIGALAADCGRFDDVQVIKALNNLAAGRLVHLDVLPFQCSQRDKSNVLPVASELLAR